MYVNKNYNIGVSVSVSTNKVAMIDVAANDDNENIGVWIRTNGGSIYLPKDLMEDCLELINNKK